MNQPLIDTIIIWSAYFWQWLIQSEDWIEAFLMCDSFER